MNSLLGMTFRQLNSGCCIQVARFHPSRLPDVLMRRLRHERLKQTESLEDKKKAFARFGAASGVDPAELFPTDNMIQEEIKAEYEWWPTLQQMKQEIAEREQTYSAKAELRSKKIAANMAKMPEWIEKHFQQTKKKKDRDSKDAVDNAKIPKFSFVQPPSHPQVMQYMQEKEKEIKENVKANNKR
uniref:Large ribosomal subunit protein mL64 n=1 Tax=Phallusia mammillata TaxID=59560 RepID=A0A6F9DDU9_9ASCI|nr:growth arrest and DNA damage-inducible proteins-interacting protein 1-like [Phallusia mammillata]